MNDYSQFIKRMTDMGCALPALVAMLPLFALVSVMVKVLSPGPVFFAQQRVGQEGRPFRIWKLRTMHVDCPQASTVSVRDDPRVYPGGGWLRKLKIDELPQLWNVVNGTMSLVGPRPTVADDYRRMDPRQRGRCRVRPGITGLAQVRGNTSLSWPQRIELDLQYVDEQTMWLDLKILAVTAWRVLTARADTHPPGDDEWEHKRSEAA